MFWKLLTWGRRVGIAQGRGEGRVGKSVDRLLGNDSLCQIKPRNFIIGQLGRGEFHVSSSHGRVRGGGKVVMGRWYVQAAGWAEQPLPDPGGICGSPSPSPCLPSPLAPLLSPPLPDNVNDRLLEKG